MADWVYGNDMLLSEVESLATDLWHSLNQGSVKECERLQNDLFKYKGGKPIIDDRGQTYSIKEHCEAHINNYFTTGEGREVHHFNKNSPEKRTKVLNLGTQSEDDPFRMHYRGNHQWSAKLLTPDADRQCAYVDANISQDWLLERDAVDNKLKFVNFRTDGITDNPTLYSLGKNVCSVKKNWN